MDITHYGIYETLSKSGLSDNEIRENVKKNASSKNIDITNPKWFENIDTIYDDSILKKNIELVEFVEFLDTKECTSAIAKQICDYYFLEYKLFSTSLGRNKKMDTDVAIFLLSHEIFHKHINAHWKLFTEPFVNIMKKIIRIKTFCANENISVQFINTLTELEQLSIINTSSKYHSDKNLNNKIVLPNLTSLTIKNSSFFKNDDLVDLVNLVHLDVSGCFVTPDVAKNMKKLKYVKFNASSSYSDFDFKKLSYLSPTVEYLLFSFDTFMNYCKFQDIQTFNKNICIDGWFDHLINLKTFYIFRHTDINTLKKFNNIEHIHLFTKKLTPEHISRLQKLKDITFYETINSFKDGFYSIKYTTIHTNDKYTNLFEEEFFRETLYCFNNDDDDEKSEESDYEESKGEESDYEESKGEESDCEEYNGGEEYEEEEESDYEE
jgi:hypothetical protein